MQPASTTAAPLSSRISASSQPIRPSSIFGTTYRQTYDILSHIIDVYVVSDSLDDEPLLEFSSRIDELLTKVHVVLGKGKSQSSSTGHTFWDGIVESIRLDYDGQGRIPVDFVIDCFTECVKSRSISPLERDKEVYFAQTGYARSYDIRGRQEATPSASQGTQPAPLPPRQQPLPRSTSPRASQPGGGDEEPISGSRRGESVDGEAGAFNPFESSGLSALERRNQLGSFQDHLNKAGTVPAVVEPVPSFNSSAEFERSDRFRSILERINSTDWSSVPPEAQATIQAQTELRSLSRDSLKALASQGNPRIPLDVRLSIIRNEYVDLGKIIAWTPQLITTTPLSDNLPGVFIERPSPTKAITDANQWAVAMQEYSEYACLFYPLRRQEFARYLQWLTRSIADQPQLASGFLQFDVAFRTQLGRSNIGFTFDDCETSRSTPLKLQYLCNPVASTSSTSSSSKNATSRQKRTAAATDEEETCDRFNYGKEHEEPCGRLHACGKCKSPGHTIRQCDKRGGAAKRGRGAGAGGAAGGAA